MNKRKGFSLVLALTMMSLLVLVILSVAGFLNIELRLASAALSHNRAKLNAIASARLAIAQLQQFAGHDQRATARADMLDPSATGSTNNTYIKLASLNDQRRWWTGVWCTGGGNGSKLRDWDPATPDTRIFLGWLVSPQGSDQKLNLTVDRTTTTTQSEAVLRQAELASTGVGARIALLGSDTLPAGTTLANGRVESNIATFPVSGGGYAWWTADEGIKARMNLPDPLAAKTGPPRLESQGVNDWWRGYVGVACGGVGIELAGTSAADTSSLPLRPSAFLPGYQTSRETAISASTSWTTNPMLLTETREDMEAWIISRSELDVATKALSVQGIARGWHDLTTSSRGVLSNQLDGGLKVDLSVGFELPFATTGTTKGWADLAWFHQSPDANALNLATAAGVTVATDPQSEEWNSSSYKLGFVYEIAIPTDERAGRGQSPFILRGPTWDVLRNHYRLYKRERELASITGVGAAFAASADAWLARGSEPYTFVQGSVTQPATAPKGGAVTISPGIFGPKSNASTFQQVASGGTANYRHSSTVTLANGESAARPWETRARLTPQVVRLGMVHSLIYCTNTIAIGIDPFLVLHNPYDVPVEFVGIGMNWAQFNNIRYAIFRADTPTSPIATCTLGQDAAQRSFTFRMFRTTTPGAWRQAPIGNIRMLPGETQIVTPNLAGDRWQVYRDKDYTNVCLGAFTYDLQSNFRVNAYQSSNNALLTQNQTAVDALVAPVTGTTSEPLFVQLQVGDQSQYNTFTTTLFRPSRYASTNNPNRANDPGYRTWLGTAVNPYADCSDEHLLQQVGFRARASNLFETGSGMLQSQPFLRYAFNDATARIPGKQFFAITDLRLRSARENNGLPMPALALNPRATHADPRNLDNAGDTSPAWSAQIRAVSGDPSLMEFQMWPGQSRNLAAWGNSFEPAAATTPVVLFQVPTRPLLSIAQLAHADISQLDIDPGYAIGNSYALPWLDGLDKIISWPTTTNALERVDIAYAANLGLWDRCFFSGFNAGTAKEFRTGTNPATGKSYDGSTQPYAILTAAVDALFLGATDVLANRRMRWARYPKKLTTDTALKEAFVDPTQTAKQIMHEGTFNVNSTSVAAWKAQLASGFQALANGTSATTNYPFSRMQPPAGESTESGNANRWATFRSLAESDSTVTKLAEAIVVEVRSRGPFMSLADFVNRRLTTDRNGRKGALHSAVDAVTAPAINADLSATTIGSSSLARIPQAAALSPTGVPAETPVPMGRPDQLLQADILAALGPGLAARSDTFVIRAYGDDGEMTNAGRAWCEVTVQRLPEWVVPSTEELNESNAAYRTIAASGRGATVDTLQRNARLSIINRQLGRRFTIVSFRWIAAPGP